MPARRPCSTTRTALIDFINIRGRTMTGTNNRNSLWPAVYLWFILLTSLPSVCAGVLTISVSPYPARIYMDAPAGVHVVKVRASDNETGIVNNFRLENRPNAAMFRVDRSGNIMTATTINYKVGTIFEFAVFAGYNTYDYRHVRIIVSARNVFAPAFDNNPFKFPVYRFGVGDFIGQVSASDADEELYNNHFTIFAQPRQDALHYIKVNKTGYLALLKPIPDAISMLDLVVMAVDSGSPQLTGSTTVSIDFLNVRQPGTFCVSTTETSTKICWKNPMPDQNFSGYTVTVKGGLNRIDVLPDIGGHNEACYNLNGTLRGEQYNFTVTVNSKGFWYGRSNVLAFRKSALGYSKNCETDNFSICSYSYPCNGQGSCMPPGEHDGPDYTCTCDSGWQGVNCTIRNRCVSSGTLCGEHGSCVFTRHDSYRCRCLRNYYGPNCEHVNQCTGGTCRNRGACKVLTNGGFLCKCLPGFSGRHCQDRDPCSPSPCKAGQGRCVNVSEFNYSCNCFDGYAGQHCEQKDQCFLKSPCLSQGTCVQSGNDYFCTCPPGIRGKRCEERDPCFVKPCSNGGQCSESDDGGFACTCIPPFHGGECQYRNVCRNVVCHHGVCKENQASGSYLCVCDDGFNGTHCDVYDACTLKESPCRNGGACISLVAPTSTSTPRMWNTSFTCECTDEWYGSRCEHENICVPGKLCENGGTCNNTRPGQFECTCPEGYFREDCSGRDSCHEHRCMNQGTCANVSDTHYCCHCPEHWLGEFCQQRSPCAPDVDLCQNGAKCILKSASASNFPPSQGGMCPQFPSVDVEAACECSPGFVGQFCQVPDPCAVNPCRNGECEILDEHKHSEKPIQGDQFRCICQQGYAECEIDLTCDGIVCLNGGKCQLGECSCPAEFTGKRCEIGIDECASFTHLNDSCECLNGKLLCKACDVVLAIRNGSLVCARLRPFQDAWDTMYRCCGPEPTCQAYQPNCTSRTHCSESGVKDESCSYYYRAEPACSGIGPCAQLQQTDLSCSDLAVSGDNGWVDCASVKLTTLSSVDPKQLDASKVVVYGKIVMDLQAASLVNRSIANLAMSSISKLANVNISVSRQAEILNKTNSKLRGFIDHYSANVPLDKSGVNNMSTNEFEVKTALIESFGRDEEVAFYVQTIGQRLVPMSITLPRAALQSVNASRLQFVGYRKSQLFTRVKSTVDGNGSDPNTDNIDMIDRQAVISATVTNCTLMNLEEPVTIRLYGIEKGQNHTCVFWDSIDEDWSTEGVTTFYDEANNKVTCTSDHLTSFAVLMSSNPAALHTEIGLTYITYVGCAVSLVCLVITLLTYALFRCLHGEKSGKILLQQCLALLLLNAMFLVGTVDVSGFSDGSCTTVALLLHYLVLASLMWMLVEAVEMYQAIVTVFVKYERLYLLKRCIIGWGIPAIIVGVTGAVDIDHYGSKRVMADGEETRICFISGKNNVVYYAALLAPACLIILVNTAVFILVARVILKPRFQQQMNDGSISITPAQIRGAFTVMFLLGITWVFGPLAIGKATVVFSYLFCICNSLQGCLIFVFRCLFNPEARLAWTQLWKTGTLKRRRGPVKSAYAESSSSKAGMETGVTHRRLSNSTSTHLSTGYQGLGSSGIGTNSLKNNSPYKGDGGTHLHPHQLHNTNGWHPNLNGLRRENGHVVDNPVHSGFDLRSTTPDPFPNKNGSATILSKADKPQPPNYPDPYATFQDELTHL